MTKDKTFDFITQCTYLSKYLHDCRPQKFDEISKLILRLLNKCQITWEISSNFDALASIRTNSQKAEESYLPEHCWWHQLRIQVIAAEMLLIYSRHIQKQHGFGLTKFYFLGQTWWYLNLMIWFEEIKSRVNMSYDFGTALQWTSIKWLSNM